MITTSRAQLGSIVSLVADASFAMLSDRINRGSLVNARGAIEERTAEQAGAAALIREFELRAPVRHIGLSAASG